MISGFRFTPVPRWYAPFSLTSAVRDRLEAAGLVEGEPHKHSIDLWIYDSPDRILDQWRNHCPSPPPLEQLLQQLRDGYQSLLSHPQGRRLISGWRIEHLEPQALASWLIGKTASSGMPAPTSLQPPAIQTFSGLLVLRLLEENAPLLDTFLDLELQSQLLGGPPDSGYLGRLQEACKPSALLNDWWEIPSLRLRAESLQDEKDGLVSERDTLQKDRNALAAQLNDSQSRCKEAQDAAQLTELQLRQVQEELEQLFLRVQDQDQKYQSQAQTLQGLTAAHENLQASSQALATERDTLTTQLNDSQSRCKEAQKAGQLTELQLRQVQEELEHYFRLYRKQGQLLDAMNHQQQRALHLLARASNVYVQTGTAQAARANRQ